MIQRVDVKSARWTVIALVGLGVSGAGGCDEFGPRVYTAQRYEPELGCLEAYAPLGLIEANEIGALCAPVCLSQDDALFVSTVCPPYPATASVEQPESEACAAALAASSCDDPDQESSEDAGAEGTSSGESTDAAAP
jgi:hypothetical protein